MAYTNSGMAQVNSREIDFIHLTNYEIAEKLRDIFIEDGLGHIDFDITHDEANQISSRYGRPIALLSEVRVILYEELALAFIDKDMTTALDISLDRYTFRLDARIIK